MEETISHSWQTLEDAGDPQVRLGKGMRRNAAIRSFILTYLIPTLLIVLTVAAFAMLVKRYERELLQSGPAVLPSNTTPAVSENINRSVLPVEDTRLHVIQDLQIISLIDLTGVGAFGNASREMSEGLFTASVVGSLPDPGEGMVYEAWLQRLYPFQMISMGRMAKNSQQRYTMTFRQEKNLLDFQRFLVTKESADDNPSPSDAIILEGSFED